MKTWIPCALTACLLAGCGGSGQPGAQNSPPSNRAGEDEPPSSQRKEGSTVERGHEHQIPLEVTAFHDAMAPLWHLEKGLERTVNTCDAVFIMKRKAEELAAAPQPSAAQNGEAWHTACGALVASVDSLIAACDVVGRPEFEARFRDVHGAFHAIRQQLDHEETNGPPQER